MGIEEKIKLWKDAKLPADLRKELNGLKGDKLNDAFYQDLKFGTAGMRGLLGVGTNRMNIYTVAQTTQALAEMINAEGKKAAKRGVVISYDSRINSKLFAQTAAEVLRANNIEVYLFNGPHPTPELSYAVLQLKTFAGIMITASHNPKEYNGYKLYGEDGGQMPPKPADAVIKARAKITDIFNIKQVKTGIKKIPASFDKQYLNDVKAVTVDKSQIKTAVKNGLKIVFTPLHGAGGKLGKQALKNAGFTNVDVVESQMEPDGQFPTVKFPNPESHDIYKIAQKEFADHDVILAVDPDSDRMGVSYKNAKGKWDYLSGNQIAALMTKYLLHAMQEAGTLPKNGVVITSNVSSSLPLQIAKSYKMKSIEVLTGFKYIADKIVEFDTKKNHTFLFGFEESYGFLIKPIAHDKDAIQAITLMGELSAFYYNQNMNLGQALDSVYEEFGYNIENTQAFDFPGESGSQKMNDLMEKFRQNPPQKIGSAKVDVVQDLQLRISKSFADAKTKKIMLPKSNMIKYLFDDNSWIALRPSGTEPKLKVYTAAVGNSKSAAKARLKDLQDGINVLIKK